jgi:hypothetical protein
MDEVYSSRLDLTDAPLLDPELEPFMDGSSFVQGGWPKAGFAVTTDNDIIQAEALHKGGLHNELNLGTGTGVAICKGKVGEHLH